MELKSVESPRRKITESEEALGAQAREVLPGTPGSGSQDASRAARQFLVTGATTTPLRQRRSVVESILNDADRRKQILETELAPWRMICSLGIQTKNNAHYVGTGWFVGPRTLITAGHCVYDPVELGGWAKQITVMPGRNGETVLPFDKIVSAKFSTTDRWLDAQDPNYDYAAIHLDQDLGSTVGTFGIAVLPDADLTGRMVNVCGYPVEPGNGQFQYFHANRVNALTPRRLFYDVDTMGGQSGCPVWVYLDDDPDATNPIVVAIHAYGVGGTPSDLSVVANSGPRILPEVLEVIKGWTQQGAKT